VSVSRRLVHVPARKAVGLVELDRAVQLEHHVAVVCRKQVDSDEIGADGPCRADREVNKPPRQMCLPALRAERHVRPPLTRPRDAFGRADDGASCNEYAQIVPDRRDECLEQRAVTLEPGPCANFVENTCEFSRRLAPKDVGAPAAEARLQDEWRRQRNLGRSRDEMCGARLRHTCALEALRGEELVVGIEQGSRAVQHADSPPLELVERVQAGLDAVERLQDVEPCERHVASIEESQRFGGREHLGGHSELAPSGGELGTRLLWPADDRDRGPAVHRFHEIELSHASIVVGRALRGIGIDADPAVENPQRRSAHSLMAMSAAGETLRQMTDQMTDLLDEEIERIAESTSEDVLPTVAEPLPPRPVDPDQKGFPNRGRSADKLAYILRYAVQAPSSHNSQPWLFRPAGEAFDLYADRTRALPVVDPDDRELVMSCGAALFHLRTAATHYCYETKVELLPEPADADLLARIELGEYRPPTYEENLLFWAIANRRTNRHAFDPTPPPAELIHELEAAAAAEGAWLAHISGEEAREAIRDLVVEADIRQLEDHHFRRELAAWIHPNRSKARDGMPAYALGLPALLSGIGPLVVRTFDIGRGVAARDRKLLNGSPSLFVLGTDEDGTADWLRAGQALDHVLLRATQDGVSASFLNQPVELPDFRPSAAGLSGRGGFAQAILRMGYGPEPPATPRRPPAEVLVQELALPGGDGNAPS